MHLFGQRRTTTTAAAHLSSTCVGSGAHCHVPFKKKKCNKRKKILTFSWKCLSVISHNPLLHWMDYFLWHNVGEQVNVEQQSIIQ